jgi:hypothetical protein
MPDKPLALLFAHVARTRAADAPRAGKGRVQATPVNWLAAAGIVGAVNAFQVATRLSPTLRPSTRLLVHGYDLGVSLGFGLLVAMAAAAVRLGAIGSLLKRRLALLVVLFVAGAALGALVLGEDLGNFVVRHHLRIKPFVLGALLGATALGLVGSLRWLVRGRLGRGIALTFGVAAAYYNAEFLVADYRGLHFFVSLFATLACAEALQLRLPSRVEQCVFGGAAVAAALALFSTPRDAVRQGLWASSGSALFPLISDWVALPRHHCDRPHPIEASEWFHERSKHPDIPSNHSRLLPARPVVLLLTVEALRSDVIERQDLGARLPTLARIRDNSLWFQNARTPSPATVVTAASLLTGKYYSQIYFTTVAPGAAEAIDDRSVRVPELLEANGVETTFVVAYRSLLGKYGIGRGFGREIKTSTNFAPATEVMQFVIDELERNRATTGAPQFLFAHFLDSHAPYNKAGEQETPFEGYLAGLGLVDQQFARLLEYIEANGQKDRVLLLVGADHGEAFGEHGMKYHGKNVYEELIRIPLMVYAPAIRPGRVTEPVTLLDLAPTVLDLFGVSTPGSFMSESLVPLLEGKGQRLRRPIAVDAGRRKQAFYFEDGIKVIFDLPAQTVELYDLLRDPQELVNLVDDPTRDLTAHIAAAERFFAVHVLRIPGWKPPWRRS